MYILVAGLRGFPGIQGGIETHAEQLYPRILGQADSNELKLEVITRSSYWGADKPPSYKSIKLTPLWAPGNPKLETLVHTLVAVLYAGFKRPDVLHLHAVGTGMHVPLARLLGLNVVITHHGPDYDREKWSDFARWVLRTSEKLGMRWAQSRIVISQTIRELVATKYGRDSDLIANGVPPADPVNSTDWLAQAGVTSGKYVLQVSRLVPEKRQLDLIKAFENSDASSQGWHLLLVGALDAHDDYQQALLAAAAANPQIILTDFQTGAVLREILTHAGAFVLPSSHEGLPIALLEALSYSLQSFASDIPANLEVPIPSDQFFPLGDIDALANLLSKAATRAWSATDRAAALTIANAYDWDVIARQTFEVYQRSLA